MTGFTRIQEIEHQIGGTGRFVLRVTSSEVELRRTDGDTARVRVEFEVKADADAEADAIFDRLQLRVTTGDGFLEITEPKGAEDGLASIVRFLGGRGGSRAERIVAELPRETTITYAGVSGDLLATGLIGEQEYKTVSGDAVLSDAAGSIQISSVSGNVSLRGAGPIELRANTVSGDLSAFAPLLGRARVVTVSGDIELEGELGEAGEHRMESVSGDLSLGIVGGLRLEVRGLSTDVDVSLPHRAEGSRDRRRYVIGNGGPAVVFSSMSGDVSVGASRRFEGRAAPPEPPIPPRPPGLPIPPRARMTDEEQLGILRALEAGEIDVAEATRRLAGERADA